ncbi:flagellar biosynthetic protein FliR [Rhodovibrio sodomensis]|uniref:Flagellar biosynthetic protein FliR n=1 Tax=Rhodovibrio sodomensis TaxID=1088 RepID=A0ABS1DDU1_9PROT|nr:flagellar biosynthetic protein FliR [Rhodovibrio sodomensis]MBK1668560.1 flagellar biosynthetic protein FliR [Rhodovibrio sodomensis]
MFQELLPATLFSVLLVFVRIGAAMSTLPGFGEAYVTPRARLILALAVALLVTPLVSDTLPGEPDQASVLLALLAGEFFIGLFIGTLARVFMSALVTGGMVMAYMSTMANALVNDPASQQQGSIIGAFLNITALVAIFGLNLHHVMLAAVVDSYVVFPAGVPPPVGDFAQLMSQTVARSFLVAMKLAAPFVVAGLVLYLGIGLLSRLMPQVQIFFAAMPLQIMKGLWLLMISLPVIIGYFTGEFADIFTVFQR